MEQDVSKIAVIRGHEADLSGQFNIAVTPEMLARIRTLRARGVLIHEEIRKAIGELLGKLESLPLD